MRIAYIVDIFPKISETFILNEILEHKRQGFDVALFALSPPHEAVVDERARILQEETNYWDKRYDLYFYKLLNTLPVFLRRPVRYLEGLNYAKDLDGIFRYNYRRTAALARHMLGRGIQHIHSHFASLASEFAMCVSLMTGIPFSVTTHGYDVYFSPHRYYKKMGERAKFVVAVSEYNKVYLSGRYGVPAEKIRVVRCGIDTEFFSPPDGKGSKDIDILSVARLHPVKGLSYLVAACGFLKGRHPGLKCVIIGEGGERNMLQKLIHEKGLEDTVSLAGSAAPDGIVDCLRRSKVFALPSSSEAMPVSVMEALSCTVPVVATNVRGVPELVEDGVNGYLVEHGNPLLLAERLSLLLADGRTRERMGVAGRQKILKEFNIGPEAAKLRDLFASVRARPAGK